MGRETEIFQKKKEDKNQNYSDQPKSNLMCFVSHMCAVGGSTGKKRRRVANFQEVKVGNNAQQEGHTSIVVYHCPKLWLKFTSSVPICL